MANFNDTVLNSCYAYAIADVMGGVHVRQGDSYVNPMLSAQEILDNYLRILLANLGSPEPAIAQAMRCLMTHGISRDIHYRRRRNTTQRRVKYKITSFEKMEVEDEEAVKAYIRSPSLLIAMVLIDDQFKNLQPGEVYRGPANCVAEHEHAVVVTGYGTVDGTQCYEVLNSWGTEWGTDGSGVVSAGCISCFWRINGVQRYVTEF